MQLKQSKLATFHFYCLCFSSRRDNGWLGRLRQKQSNSDHHRLVCHLDDDDDDNHYDNDLSRKDQIQILEDWIYN